MNFNQTDVVTYDIISEFEELIPSRVYEWSQYFETGNRVVDWACLFGIAFIVFTVALHFLRFTFFYLMSILWTKERWAVINIKHSVQYSPLDGYTSYDLDNENAHDTMPSYHLVDAVLMYLEQKEVVSAESRWFLSDEHRDSSNEYMEHKTAIIFKIPNEEVKVDDVEVLVNITKRDMPAGRGRNALEVKYHIAISKPGTDEKPLVAWLRKAYDEYVKIRYRHCKDTADELKYYLPATSEESDSTGEIMYSEYSMKTKRTFDTLFIPDKEDLIRLIDDFNAKGKDQDRKLSFLLYGAPGCGKTTFIKALARRTKRHVISVNLSAAKTNEQLFNMFHNDGLSYKYLWMGRSETTFTWLKPHERIYIIEDLDAGAFDIVRRRDTKVKAPSAASQLQKMMLGARAFLMKQKEQEGGMDGGLKGLGKRGGGGGGGGLSKGKGMGSKAMKWLSSDSFASMSRDKVSLAGILNLLDGIVELSGSIIVMTTNHPELLDPALIRPGRVTRKVYFGYIEREQALEMLCYFFGAKCIDEAGDECKALWARVRGGLVSPAEFEYHCKNGKATLCETLTAWIESEEKAERTLRRLQRQRDEKARQDALLRETMAAAANAPEIDVTVEVDPGTEVSVGD